MWCPGKPSPAEDAFALPWCWCQLNASASSVQINPSSWGGQVLGDTGIVYHWWQPLVALMAHWSMSAGWQQQAVGALLLSTQLSLHLCCGYSANLTLEYASLCIPFCSTNQFQEILGTEAEFPSNLGHSLHLMNSRRTSRERREVPFQNLIPALTLAEATFCTGNWVVNRSIQYNIK